MVSLSLILYDIPGRVPRVDVLFCGRHDFHKLLEQGHIKKGSKSLLWKFYGRYGDLIKQYEVPLSRMRNDILEATVAEWLSSWLAEQDARGLIPRLAT